MKKFIIITTINGKTKSISEFEKLDGWHLIVVGDQKSQKIKSTPKLTYLSIEDQQTLEFSIVERLPYNHYARKNIGYLYAIREGADIIYDTDDDNTPYPHWGHENFDCGNFIHTEGDFLNIYQYFTKESIWPRGFPLDLVRQSQNLVVEKSSPVKIGVWQGLADADPDVDAVYRLIFNKEVEFDHKEPVALPPGKFCPFNSQNTFWAKEAFPLLYLPALTSFRFTDILRGFVAQRLLWENGLHLGFQKASVRQSRNTHDYMEDFKDEVECFIKTKDVVALLKKLEIGANQLENLDNAYRCLSNKELINPAEIIILDAWGKDLVKASKQ